MHLLVHVHEHSKNEPGSFMKKGSRMNHVSLTSSSPLEEDYGDDVQIDQPKKQDNGIEIEYWHVNLPSEDLENLMWGIQGVPSFSSSISFEFEKNSVTNENRNGGDDGVDVTAEDNIGQNFDGNESVKALKDHDNILSAIERASSIEEIDCKDSSESPDCIILEDIAWKQRSGFGKYYMGIINHEWEQRCVTLMDSGKLRYYALPSHPTGQNTDSNDDFSAEKIPSVSSNEMEPRGEMNMRTNNDDGIPTVKVKARHQNDNPGPTPFEIAITRKDTNETWRFCFQTQATQNKWKSKLKEIAFNGYENKDDSDESEEEEYGDSFDGLDNHGFQPGDHIIRWEMLPIIYPIQIHGIVLEAGKNCVIIADFGLTSYDSQGGVEGLSTWQEEKAEESHDFIVAAWEKIKPKQKKRLNVLAITDSKEIRKWSKISYGQSKEKKEKKSFFTSLLGVKSARDKTKEANKVKESELHGNNQSVNDDNGEIQDAITSKIDDTLLDEVIPLGYVEGEPEWFRRDYKVRVGPASTHDTSSFDDGQSVFSIDRLEKNVSKLPKSDSAQLVLARTHFILENEELLPPYHVFYSNSECIAVWCKTGRWSTLQAAVYLVSQSVGLGKSATMLTLSVAAAHMILLPALAVGGLAVVGTPLLYLKKSQTQWEKATRHLTDEFWSRAEPEVFVEAILYWGGCRRE